MPYADWAAVTRDLDTTLARLRDHEFFILGEPAPATDELSDPFGLQPLPVRTRYVQVLRLGEVVSAECVGATSQGGSWNMDDPTIEVLLQLGWLTPEECRTELGCATPNFVHYLDLESVHALPDVLVATLALLGARPEELMLESSAETPPHEDRAGATQGHLR
jgi:hypothetical protein